MSTSRSPDGLTVRQRDEAASQLEAEGKLQQAEALYRTNNILVRQAHAKDATSCPRFLVAVQLNNLALCLKQQKRYAEASKLYEEAVELYKADYESFGETYHESTDPSIKNGWKMIVDGLHNAEHNLASCLHEARRTSGVAEEAEEAPAPSTAAEWKEFGNALFKQGHFREAGRAYWSGVDALGSEPEMHGTLLTNAAMAHLKIKEWAMAAEAARRATELAPTNGKAFLRLGTALLSTPWFGNVQKAMVALEQAAVLLPGTAEVDAALRRAHDTEEFMEQTTKEPPPHPRTVWAKWRTTAAARLDAMIGERGRAAVLLERSEAFYLHDAYEGWVDALRRAWRYKHCGEKTPKQELLVACKEAWELGGEASMPGTILRDMHRALATHRDGCWFRQCVDGQLLTSDEYWELLGGVSRALGAQVGLPSLSMDPLKSKTYVEKNLRAWLQSMNGILSLCRMLVLMAHFELTLDMPQQGVDHLVIAYKWFKATQDMLEGAEDETSPEFDAFMNGPEGANLLYMSSFGMQILAMTLDQDSDNHRLMLESSITQGTRALEGARGKACLPYVEASIHNVVSFSCYELGRFEEAAKAAQQAVNCALEGSQEAIKARYNLGGSLVLCAAGATVGDVRNALNGGRRATEKAQALYDIRTSAEGCTDQLHLFLHRIAEAHPESEYAEDHRISKADAVRLGLNEPSLTDAEATQRTKVAPTISYIPKEEVTGDVHRDGTSPSEDDTYQGPRWLSGNPSGRPRPGPNDGTI